MELKEKMDRMVEELNAANYRYYVLDDPTMDDRDYDLKLRELEELEKDHPELARADSPQSGWAARPCLNLKKLPIRCR